MGVEFRLILGYSVSFWGILPNFIILQRGHRPTHFHENIIILPFISYYCADSFYQNTILLPKNTYYFTDSFWMIFAKKEPFSAKINIFLREDSAPKIHSFCRFCGSQQILLGPMFLYRKYTTAA